jgi:hypothetical protein
MSFANDPQFLAFLHSHKHIALPIGTVFILSYSESMPPVARRLTRAEGLQYKEQLKSILGEWSIVAFDQGGLTGSGYHHEVKEQVGTECGEGFIVIQGQYN